MLKLKEEERKTLEKEINEILKAFEKIDEINVDEELIVHPIEIKNILRKDEIKGGTKEYLEKLKENGYIIGPKTVLGEEE